MAAGWGWVCTRAHNLQCGNEATTGLQSQSSPIFSILSVQHPGGEEVLLEQAGTFNAFFQCFVSCLLFVCLLLLCCCCWSSDGHFQNSNLLATRSKQRGGDFAVWWLLHGVALSPSLPPGKDATEAFEDVGHSPDARETQAQYLIGTVTEPAAKRIEVSYPSSDTELFWTELINRIFLFSFLRRKLYQQHQKEGT